MNTIRGLSPLHIAAARGHVAVVSALLRGGVDPNLKDSCLGWAPLSHAIWHRHIPVVKILIACGALISVFDRGIPPWVNRVMRGLTSLIGCDSKAGYRVCPGKNDSASSPDCGNIDILPGTEPSSAAWKRTRKKKDSSGEDQEDGPNKRRRLDPKKGSDIKKTNLRLACPFYKIDPAKHCMNRTCTDPRGYSGCNRIKEHMAQKHVLPIHCPRCRCEFKNDTELKAHYTAITGCDARLDARDYSLGYDAEQEKKLKRLSLRQFQSQEDFWREIFRTCFPEVEELNIPSPFADQRVETFEQYDEYANRKRVQNGQLRGEIERVLVNSSLSRPDQITEILNIVNTQQPSIREQYLQRQGSRESLHFASLSLAAGQLRAQPDESNPINCDMPTPTAMATSWEQMPITEMLGPDNFSTRAHQFPPDGQMTDSGFDSTSRRPSTTTAYEQYNPGIGELRPQNLAHEYNTFGAPYLGHQSQVPDYPEQINPPSLASSELAELSNLFHDEHVNSSADYLDQE
ncbi:hypothetical protein AOQ84DRAFT_373198 [Glonium stellatum]|uniref:Uncharacterized protein n=1 Tax=Glonium stellatum TaxID=574774 RepID=A0A8E2F862_9PEZI|nr:hypothetical protein AOQ84DRAFT_373198 [Glonium stellatum]